jgi:hypothetical protein
MPVYSIRKLDSVRLGASGTVFQGLRDAEISADIQNFVEYAAGQAQPTFVGLQESKPAVRFTTHELAKLIITEAITLCGKTYADIGLFMASAARTCVGKIARDGDHTRFLMAEGLVFWEQIRLSHNQVADARVVALATYDGTNAPITYSGAVDLPTAAVPNQYYGAGPCYINGTLISGIQETVVQSGFRVRSLGADSEGFPTFVGIEQVEPMITVRTTEPVSLTSITGLTGGTLTSGSGGFVAYGRKYAVDGTGAAARVANATTEHLKIEALYGTIQPMNVQGQGSQEVTDTFKVVPRANALESTGSNALTFSLAAIP